MPGKSGIRLWAAGFWILLWQLAAMALDQELLLASPLRVLESLTALALTGGFWAAAAGSLLRIGTGFLLAVVTGSALAALSARFRWAEELLAPLMTAVRAVPVASFIILALILFSARNLAVLISFLMVLPVFYFNTLEGIRAVDRELLEMARVFRIPVGRRLRYLYLPRIFPHFRSACDVGVGMSWKSGVAAEVIGVCSGSIGEHLYNAKVYLETPELLAWTLTVILLSLLCQRLLKGLLERLRQLTERI